MQSCYYELLQAPDFSLSKYASLSETGPGGVLNQHNAFWRQMNQWGKLFKGSIHLIYQFNPDHASGKRMRMLLRFDSPDMQGIKSVRQIMGASVLAPYYDQLVLIDDLGQDNHPYRYQVNLIKSERFIHSSYNEKDIFYTACEWKMNDAGRLYSMFRILVASEVHSTYCVDLYPVDYNIRIEKDLSIVMPHLRELNSFKVKTGSGSVSSGGRDENAKRALDYYEDLGEDMAASPHFLVNVQVLSDEETAARQILDAAASEAISEGNYELIVEPANGTIQDVIDEGFICLSSEEAPQQLLYLPHLMTVDEIVPYATLPVLYPGEQIELPKETLPKPEEGMLLGHDPEGHEIAVPWKNLAKHAFLAGMPGSGKTNTMMYLISEMVKNGIPILVLEPAKKEYRSLISLKEMEEVALYSPCANSMFPIHINPFEFPIGMKLSDHMNRLLDVFNGTFQLDPPMPMLLTEGIQKCYEDLYWLPGMVNRGLLEYPTMTMLYENIEKLLDKYQYAEEVRSNLQSILQVRIGSLLSREMGDIFDVKYSTIPPEKWLNQSGIVELAALGTAPSNFMILMLMTLIRESLDQIPYQPEKNGGKPRHVIFLEEAHNLIADTSVQQPGALDPKISATAFITKMLAEVRALGEAIIIADQLPTAMAPEVIKNTSLKIGLRLTSQDERELLGSTMSADGVQIERMGILNPGQCIVGYEGLLKPFELQIPHFKGDDVSSDRQLLQESVCRKVYHDILQRSVVIMSEKFNEQEQKLKKSDLELDKLYQKNQETWKKHDEEVDRDQKTNAILSGTERKQLINDHHKLLNENIEMYEQFTIQMEKRMRLYLDICLYGSISKGRRRTWQSLDDLSQEIKVITEKSNDDWDKYLEPVLMEAKSGFMNFKNKWSQRSYHLKAERTQGFILQQKIISRLWE